MDELNHNTTHIGLVDSQSDDYQTVLEAAQDLATTAEKLADQVQQLQFIVDVLPELACGEKAYPGRRVWFAGEEAGEVGAHECIVEGFCEWGDRDDFDTGFGVPCRVINSVGHRYIQDCYSTPEAAEAALDCEPTD